MRNVGRRCTGYYAKEETQQSRAAGNAAAKKMKTLYPDCDKFFVLSVLIISIIRWNKGFK